MTNRSDDADLTMMLSKVQSALANLSRAGEPLLVGVSGGADSVALLDVLVQAGFRPHICHLNHRLRSTYSDTDAEFVAQLAKRYDLPVTIESRDVAASAADQKLSLEDAARRARQEFFAAVAGRTGINKLALAHTADDQVETFLLRLLRGAGMPGLGGIWPERQIGPLCVIRPLLGVRRTEIMDYLSERQLAHCEDASNADTRFTRNRIRHELLPLLEREYNPAIREVLARTTDILREEDQYLSEQARAHVADALHFPTLTKLPVALQRRIIRQWLNLEFDHIEAVRNLTGELHLPGGTIVYREQEWLRKTLPVEPVRGQWPVSLVGETVIQELSVRFLVAAVADRGPHLPGEEQFDADALGSKLFVRTWQDGDRFQPLGMTAEKKLQDFFVDEKVPRRQRGRTPLLCAADGRIAWVVGCRIADPFKVTERTRRILRVRCESVQR